MNPKVTLSTSLKLPKHKQSGGSKTSSSGMMAISSSGQSQVSSSTASGNCSPSKSSMKPATLKLKNINLPASTTITPIPAKATVSSPTSTQAGMANPTVSSTSISIIATSSSTQPTTSTSKPSQVSSNNSGGNSKSSKSLLRSRKGSLSAVIDKLMFSASNAQHATCVSPEMVSKQDGGGRIPDTTGERKETKLDKKDSLLSKESKDSLSKAVESKSKYTSNDQFTVKQSSQGIKLTVTKTRSSDGTYKSTSSKVKTPSHSNKSLSLPSSSPQSTNKPSSSATNVKLGSSVAKKTSSASTGAAGFAISNKGHNVLTLPKVSGSSAQKNPQPTSSSVTKVSSSSSANSNKLSAKPILSHLKAGSSSSKGLDKSDKPRPSNPEGKNSFDGKSDKVCTSTTGLMPPPQSLKYPEHGKSGGSTPKRPDESPVRKSPRHTPTRDSQEESEGERAFRMLLAQSKVDTNSGSDQRMQVFKPVEITSANDIGIQDISLRPDIDDKPQRVSSSTDIKPSSMPRTPVLIEKNGPEINDSSNGLAVITEMEKRMIRSEAQTSSGRVDTIVTTSISLSDDLQKPPISPPFIKPNKPRRPNPSSDDNSSPEDGLVIDCPGTPRFQLCLDKKVRTSSPRPESVTSSILQDPITQPMPSPGISAKSPYQPSPPLPVVTPPSNHSVSSSISRPSPCSIDDDLMDEALMGLGK